MDAMSSSGAPRNDQFPTILDLNFITQQQPQQEANEEDNPNTASSDLRDIIHELGLDAVGDLESSGTVANIVNSNVDNIGTSTATTAAGLTTVSNSTLITSPDNKYVFELVDESRGDQKAQAQLPVKSEAEEIMANLTGFGIQQASPNISVGMNRQNMIGQQQFQAQERQLEKPYVRITEEPAENKLRFRYECEGRSAGSLQGAQSTHDNKTYPTIQIVGYNGPAVCVVSLVEHIPPYRAHPHKLVSKDGMCKYGVCSVEISRPDMTYTFQNLGIQCVRKADAKDALTERQKIKVDPFKQGFAHIQKFDMDLNMVRLCFQVFLKTERGLVPLEPVVSKNVIKDRKAFSDLKILEHSDDRCSVEGGKKILIFCEKVNKDDIEVHFQMRKKNGEEMIVKGEFTPNDVHKQYGICFRTPRHINPTLEKPENCPMFLFKPKSKEYSDPIDFWYLPNNQSNRENQADSRQVNKRTRQPHANPDESSGAIACPRKVNPAQLHGGGQVVDLGSSPARMNILPDGSTNFTQQHQYTANIPLSETSSGTRTSSPYSQVTLVQNPTANGGRIVLTNLENVDNNIGKVNTMTQELQNLLRGDGDMFGTNTTTETQATFHTIPAADSLMKATVPAEFNRSSTNTTQPTSNLKTTTVLGGPGLTSLNAFLQSNPNLNLTDGNVSTTVADTNTLPNLSVSEEFGDMDNLSSTLDSNLKIEKDQDFIEGNAGPGMNQQFQRQSSQLQTPDVSTASISMENVNVKRNIK